LLRVLSNGFYRYEMGAARHRDTRVGLLAHALNQIRMIKAMALETSVQEEIAGPRARELAERRNYVGNLARFLFTTTFLNAVVIVVTFGLYLAQGHVLTPAVAFSTMAMLRVIRRVVETIPLCVGGVSQRLMALERIREVWSLEAARHD
jgi:ABC-type bacteriocin/lantibiotic exporter with double-glycine peptidase domain